MTEDQLCAAIITAISAINPAAVQATELRIKHIQDEDTQKRTKMKKLRQLYDQVMSGGDDAGGPSMVRANYPSIALGVG